MYLQHEKRARRRRTREPRQEGSHQRRSSSVRQSGGEAGGGEKQQAQKDGLHGVRREARQQDFGEEARNEAHRGDCAGLRQPNFKIESGNRFILMADAQRRKTANAREMRIGFRTCPADGCDGAAMTPSWKDNARVKIQRDQNKSER